MTPAIAWLEAKERGHSWAEESNDIIEWREDIHTQFNRAMYACGDDVLYLDTDRNTWNVMHCVHEDIPTRKLPLCIHISPWSFSSIGRMNIACPPDIVEGTVFEK
jgi:hypothetical protein